MVHVIFSLMLHFKIFVHVLGIYIQYGCCGFGEGPVFAVECLSEMGNFDYLLQ